LWSHTEGVDKDLRMLLSDQESQIKAYVVRHNVKNQAKFAEAVQDYKATHLTSELFKLKPIWVPDGFDADSESERRTMRDFITSAVVQDILFNVVFGRLTSDDVEIFLSATGFVGLQLALLAYIAEHPMGNLARPSEALDVSPGAIRDRLLILQAAGFVGNPNGRPGFSIINEVTVRGRVFLDILRRLEVETATGSISAELEYVLTMLGCASHRLTTFEPDPETPPTQGVAGLLVVMRGARDQWGLRLQQVVYRAFDDEVATTDSRTEQTRPFRLIEASSTPWNSKPSLAIPAACQAACSVTT
jgi:hypothetical protein